MEYSARCKTMHRAAAESTLRWSFKIPFSARYQKAPNSSYITPTSFNESYFCFSIIPTSLFFLFFNLMGIKDVSYWPKNPAPHFPLSYKWRWCQLFGRYRDERDWISEEGEGKYGKEYVNVLKYDTERKKSKNREKRGWKRKKEMKREKKERKWDKERNKTEKQNKQKS